MTETTSTDLVRAEESHAIAASRSSIPGKREIDDLARLANALARSGFFKDIASAHQAFAKLLFGRDLGISGTAAMTGVHIIEGKPEVSANVQAQFVNTYVGPDGERYRYRVRELDNTHCKIEFFERELGEAWESLGFSEYSMADAEKAKLAHKDNYKKHPRNMLFARALSDGVAFMCPQVTNGVRTYHDYEIDVDGNARDTPPAAPPDEVVDATPVISGEDVAGLVAVIEEAGVDDKWLQARLVAAGLDDASDPRAVSTLGRLTPDGAKLLLDELSSVVDEQAAADAA